MSTLTGYACTLGHFVASTTQALQRIPHSLIAFIARFSIAAVFWQSGQTKVEGFALDFVSGTFEWGTPHLADSALYLFSHEYKVPLLPAEFAAYAATVCEHLFPVLILVGLATRFSALALLGLTLTIQLFVYPDAYATHGTCAPAVRYTIGKPPASL